MKRLTVTLTVVFVLLLTLVGGTLIVARFSDGPLGPIAGGSLSGDILDAEHVDWVGLTAGAIHQHNEPLFIELELAATGRSRMTGVILRDGEIYIPCDLGFGWARFSGTRRWILNLIYLVKDWHNQVLLDDRVVLRLAGKRYPGRAAKVEEAELIEALKVQMEGMVEGWQDGEPWGPRPVEGPKDIWFFHIQAR